MHYKYGCPFYRVPETCSYIARKVSTCWAFRDSSRALRDNLCYTAQRPWADIYMTQEDAGGGLSFFQLISYLRSLVVGDVTSYRLVIRHQETSKKTWIFISTAGRTSNMCIAHEQLLQRRNLILCKIPGYERGCC